MKLELSIANDAELRAFIKDSIKNEIVSLTRKEVADVVVDAVKSAAKLESIDDLINKIIKQYVEKSINAYYGGLSISFIRDTASKMIIAQIQERVNDCLNDTAIKELVENRLKTVILTVNAR